MTEAKEINDCFLHDKERLRHHQALDILKQAVRCTVGTETIALENGLGRILAEDVFASQNVPLADNAAVDGYAFRFDDFEEAGGFFRLGQRIAAGKPSVDKLGPWAAARIFTGAVLPEGADTIAMQEDCESHQQDGSDFVIVPQGLQKGANCRLAGEDVSEGTHILAPGANLRPQDLAAIASTGLGKISVYQKLKVGIFSTGDELRRPGGLIGIGDVFDSNFFLLRGLAESLPIEITDLGILRDNETEVANSLKSASDQFDVLLTTGGASRGEEDHLLCTLDKIGKRHMWQLAIKPGRPMMFGNIRDCIFLGLPGNPVAAMICFLLYARPLLNALGGGPFLEPQSFMVPAGFDVPRKKPDRREFYRAYLENDPSGVPTANKFMRDGSGLISSLRAANGLLEIPEEVTSVNAGDLVRYIPFSEFGIN